MPRVAFPPFPRIRLDRFSDLIRTPSSLSRVFAVPAHHLPGACRGDEFPCRSGRFPGRGAHSRRHGAQLKLRIRTNWRPSGGHPRAPRRQEIQSGAWRQQPSYRIASRIARCRPRGCRSGRGGSGPVPCAPQRTPGLASRDARSNLNDPLSPQGLTRCYLRFSRIYAKSSRVSRAKLPSSAAPRASSPLPLRQRRRRRRSCPLWQRLRSR